MTFGDISAEEAANTTKRVCTYNVVEDFSVNILCYNIRVSNTISINKLLTIQSVNFSILETLGCPQHNDIE